MTDKVSKSGHMFVRRRSFLVAFLAIAIAWCANPASLHAQDKAQTLRAIRDAAISDLGWMTGNAKGTPAWEKVAPYTAPGGKYYEKWMHLKPAGADSKKEFEHNLKVFQEGYDKGRNVQYNEAESLRRAKDLAMRAKQLEALGQNTNSSAASK